MLRNYLKIALRNLQRNKAQAAINIVGLAMGMAITLLIALWVVDEISYDRYHRNHRKIDEVMDSQAALGHTYIGPTIATPLGTALHAQYKDLFERISLISYPFDLVLGVGDKHLSASSMWSEPELPEMFTFRMTRGTAASIKDPSTLLLSQSMATALFGKADPLNKTIRLNNTIDLRVGGVYEDLPRNTTFNGLQVLLPWTSQYNGLRDVTDWDNHGARLFVQLRDHVTTAQAMARIRSVPTPFVKEDKEESFLQPLDKLHFAGEIIDGKVSDTALQMVWLLGIIGGFVLLLACINFMNLSTARSGRRAKEVGIRKTVGTLRSQLVTQFLTESVLVAFIASLLSLVLAQFSLPYFNDLSAKDMTMPWDSPLFWTYFLGFTLLTGIVAGSYPAFYLSAFKPIRVLKGVFRAGRAAALPREILVVLQFTVSLSLIIGTVIVFKQIGFAKDRPLGYHQSGLVTVNINTDDLDNHYDALRSDLLQTGLFDNVARSSQPTSNFDQNNSLEWPGMDPSQKQIDFRDVVVTPEFGSTIGWHIVRGRDFSRAFPSDSGAMILNETAAKTLGFKDPIGKVVKYFDHPFTIIGVAEDMLTNRPFDPIQPAVFMERGGTGIITLRIKAGVSPRKALGAMSTLFKQYNPSSPFTYKFNDAEFDHKFEAEERVGKLAGIFAILAIFISCLGLFGLASFMAEQRTKEIGVRKVLGAGLLSLWGLLSRDFVKLAAISLVIAIPLTYWGMHQWLQHYVYRTPLAWWIFATAGAAMILVALATVSYQCLRAAMMNPVRSLRVE